MLAMRTRRRFDAERFRTACCQMGLSTERLASLVGASSSYLAHVRIGAVPGADMRARVAAALRVPESELWPAAEETEAA